MSRNPLLLLPAYLLGWIAIARNFLYDRKWIKSTRFDFPLVTIGNLNAGGTGKTPLTEWIAFHLQSEFKVSTLSRGYGRKFGGFREVTPDANVHYTGDEPLQLKWRVPATRVFVGEDRVMSVPRILQTYPDTDVILLDDAFQHRRIKAGLNILLTRFDDLYTRDQMFPAGMLREPVEGYHRADVLVVNQCPANLSEQQMEDLRKELNPLPYQKLYFTIPWYGEAFAAHQPNQTLRLSDADSILMLTGIADNSPLKTYLEQSGKPVFPLKFPDHHRYDRYDLEKLRDLHAGLPGPRKPIVTTWKDFVRLREFASWFMENKLEVYVQPVSLIFAAGKGQEFLTDLRRFIQLSKTAHQNHSE